MRLKFINFHSFILMYYAVNYTFIADTVGTLSLCPHERESIRAGVYISQTSAIHFSAWNLADVRFKGVSARQELTVITIS